ncbi:MAG: hypothetical protein P4L51_29920 [Puia sp.]|nr:hypothetical protein [Puia sp.]
MKHLILTGALFLAIACHQKNSTNDVRAGKGGADSAKKAFFPVLDYLNGEIAYVDSTPIAISKYNTEGTKTDSTFISPQEFHQLAQEFIAPELDSASFNREYEETSFMDETTKQLTLTYSTGNGKLTVQRVDVLARQTDDGASKVSGIYLEKRENRHDTLVVKKMYWQPKKQFQVTTMAGPKGQDTRVRQLKVVWNIRE